MIYGLNWRAAYKQVQEDPSIRYTVKSALEMALDVDPLDAARDSRLIAEILQARCDQKLGCGDGIVASEECKHINYNDCGEEDIDPDATDNELDRNDSHGGRVV